MQFHGYVLPPSACAKLPPLWHAQLKDATLSHMHSVDDKKNWRDAALTFPRPNAVATAPTIQSKCRGQQNVRKKSPSLKDDWWNENIHPSILPLAALSNTLKGIRD